jgi:hypothetical protein
MRMMKVRQAKMGLITLMKKMQVTGPGLLRVDQPHQSGTGYVAALLPAALASQMMLSPPPWPWRRH